MLRKNPWTSELTFKGINNSRIGILGWVQSQIELDRYCNYELYIKLFIVPDNTITCEMLIGRDFLTINSALKSRAQVCNSKKLTKNRKKY
jgi:hypothetical protein